MSDEEDPKESVEVGRAELIGLIVFNLDQAKWWLENARPRMNDHARQAMNRADQLLCILDDLDQTPARPRSDDDGIPF